MAKKGKNMIATPFFYIQAPGGQVFRIVSSTML
jgi:hypothetical protein